MKIHQQYNIDNSEDEFLDYEEKITDDIFKAKYDPSIKEFLADNERYHFEDDSLIDFEM